jgi:pimeloyl-ACP methyl ester carboxylesterase
MTMSFIEERRSTYAGTATRELVVDGAGPTVLLLHGFGDAADTWRPLLNRLKAAGRAAVAVDLPGFGQAGPMVDGDVLPQLDAFVAAAIRAYGGTEGVVVVGNSLGGAAAARAALDRGLPVVALMTLGVAGITWKPLAASARVLAACLWTISAIPIPEAVHRAVVTGALSRLLYGERSAVDPQMVARFAEACPELRVTQRLVRLGARCKAELDRTRWYRGIGVPMTVIHGARDMLVPVSASRILHEATPGSRLVILASAGHCPQLDATDVVARLACELATNSTAHKEIS